MASTLEDYQQQCYQGHMRQQTLSLQKEIGKTQLQYFLYVHVRLDPSFYQSLPNIEDQGAA